PRGGCRRGRRHVARALRTGPAPGPVPRAGRAGECRRHRAAGAPGWLHHRVNPPMSNPEPPTMDHLKSKIRNVPDFPKPGILFYDITTLLSDARGFKETVDALAAPYLGDKIDIVVGIESRGFILGAAV